MKKMETSRLIAKLNMLLNQAVKHVIELFNFQELKTLLKANVENNINKQSVNY